MRRANGCKSLISCPIPTNENRVKNRIGQPEGWPLLSFLRLGCALFLVVGPAQRDHLQIDLCKANFSHCQFLGRSIRRGRSHGLRRGSRDR